jgi:hypothetical protein
MSIQGRGSNRKMKNYILTKIIICRFFLRLIIIERLNKGDMELKRAFWDIARFSIAEVGVSELRTASNITLMMEGSTHL